jgi:hypothetical protein
MLFVHKNVNNFLLLRMQKNFKKSLNLLKFCQIFLILTLLSKVYLLNCPLNTWACNDGIQCINATLRCNKFKVSYTQI